MNIIAEIRRLYFIEHETVSALARLYKLSRPTIRKHLNTVEEPTYHRKEQPHPKLGIHIEQLTTWLQMEALLPRKQRRTGQRLYECLQQEGYSGGYSAVQRYVKAWKKQHTNSPGI